jgi:hypothetical protein
MKSISPESPTKAGQNIIIKYLQQILFVAIIGFCTWLFNSFSSLQAKDAEKDRIIVNLQDQIKNLRDDVDDDEKRMDEINREHEDLKDDHTARLIKLEDGNCKSNK